MPAPLTRSQKAVLIRGGKDDKAIAKGVRRITGEALQRRGYGHYQREPGKFYLNDAGLRFALEGETLEDL